MDWDAIEKAWQRNAKAEDAPRGEAARGGAQPVRARSPAPKIVGGSTITQQLAKNLLLSGERTLLRKGQEFVLAFALEKMLSKQRILEIYLNSVEWGEGVFGAEAAARHYYPQERGAAVGVRSSAAGRDAAAAQVLRETARLGLPLRAAPRPSRPACATRNCLRAPRHHRAMLAKLHGLVAAGIVRMLTGRAGALVRLPTARPNSASTSPTTRATPTW